MGTDGESTAKKLWKTAPFLGTNSNVNSILLAFYSLCYLTADLDKS
jgi:hypothetical protein